MLWSEKVLSKYTPNVRVKLKIIVVKSKEIRTANNGIISNSNTNKFLR